MNSQRNALKQDRTAISDLIKNDPTASAALAKYLADCATRSTTLQADMAKLAADTKQLKLDLAAQASTDGTGGSSSTSTDTSTT